MKGKQSRTINPKPKPGPQAASLAHAGNWESTVKNALAKKRPPEGWPKPEKPETKRRAPSGGPKQASRLQPKTKQAKLKNRKGS